MNDHHDGTSFHQHPGLTLDGDNVDEQQQQQQHLLTLPSADVIRLILAHLTECGLHESARTIQQESGIGCAGSSFQSPQDWIRYASTGQWGIILKQLSLLDRSRIQQHHRQQRPPQEQVINVIAAVHEMTILELAEVGEWETAFAMFRLLQQDEQIASSMSEIATSTATTSSNHTNTVSIHRSLEQKLAQLMAQREKDPTCPVPNDYYGITIIHPHSSSNNNNDNSRPNPKQIRRQVMGQRLQAVIPVQPPQRLSSLLQQAIKWQSYTGQLPMVRRAWSGNDDDDDDEPDRDNDDNGDDGKRRHNMDPMARVPNKKRTKKEFDLVLGEVTVDDSMVVGSTTTHTRSSSGSGRRNGGPPISGMDYATIKFGKNATPEIMTFLPDGTGLVTGSSDGFVEVWDHGDGRLRKDLLYQQSDDSIMGHFESGAAISALAMSNDMTLLASGAADGIVHVWRFDTGKCLRTISTSAADPRSNSVIGGNNGVSCLCFSPDCSHILTGNNDGICREYGLRTSRMMKEFRGHTAYITSCFYHLQTSPTANSSEELQLLVITASGDGTVRIWDGKTMDTISVFRPVSVGLRSMLSQVHTSIATIDIDRLNQTASNEGSPTIHSVLKLHTPRDSLIIVPRGQRAFLVDYTGRVQRIFEDDSSRNKKSDETCFVAATVNSTNLWLYMIREDGKCCIFDVQSGQLERTIHDFAKRCISSSTTVTAEISSMAHHPIDSILAAFSNDKGQKRGKLVLWK